MKFLEFNAHLIPSIAAPLLAERSDGNYRAKRLGEIASQYDLVALCECFDPTMTDQLLDSLEQKAPRRFYRARSHTPSHYLIGGGLLILSRFKLDDTHEYIYRNSSTVFTNGLRAERLVAKGILHARVRLPCSELPSLDCFVTHMDSRSRAVRQLQLDELVRFVQTHANPKIPFVLTGDFNIAQKPADVRSNSSNEKSEYESLLARLQSSGFNPIDSWLIAGTGHAGTADALATDGGERIDYLFISQFAGYVAQPAYVRTLAFRDSRVREGTLSDHKGLECLLELRATPRRD